MTDITKTSEKLFVWERGLLLWISFFFHLKHFSNINIQPRRDVIFVGKKILPKNGLPSPSGSPRTWHPRLHPCYVRRRPTDRSQFWCFFRWNQQTAGFTPRNWLVLDGFFRCVSSFSENEKGIYFQVLLAVCFPGVWKIISPWIIFPRASWGMSGKHVGQKMEKTMKRKRLIINGLRNIIGNILQ